MRYGQAAVEHGFRIYKDILKSNMSQETVISKIVICDHMRSNQLNLHTVEINNVIILAFKAASSKYKIHCQDNQK